MFKPASERAPFAPVAEVLTTEGEGEEGAPLERYEGPDYFVLSWIARDWGFGTTTFSRREEGDGLYCGDEFMRLEGAAKVLANYCEKTPQTEWPALLREYGGVEQVMAAVVDWESKPRDTGS